MTWREAWPIWLTFGILASVGAFVVWVLMPATPVPVQALLRGEDVTLTIQELQPNLPRLFAYPLEPGRTTEFFVERRADTTIIAAFASCRRCYRSGHYRHGGQILCGRCNEPMIRVTAGQTPATDSDCTQMPILFQRLGDRLTIRAGTVRDTFTRWYAPLIAQNKNSSSGNQN